MNTLCKRPDGTTCGRETVDGGNVVLGRVKVHRWDNTPADKDCTLPPVCWTCGEAIEAVNHAMFGGMAGDWYEHKGWIVEKDRLADGTRPEPGQERCRRQKATECAQGRELCSGPVSAHPGNPDSYCHQHHTRGLHHDDSDGSPCLGPECKDRRSYPWDYHWDPSCGCLEHNVFACDLCPPEHRARGQVTDRRVEERRKSKGIVTWIKSTPHYWRGDGYDADSRISDRRKAHPSTGGQIIEQRERTRDAEASAALAADSDRDGTGSRPEPGIVERLRWHAEIYRRANPPGRPVDEADELDEAAAHIEGLEARLPTLSEALVKERAERARLEAENQRLREALRVSACHRNAMVPRKGIAQGLYIKSIHGNGDCGECPPCLERKETP